MANGRPRDLTGKTGERAAELQFPTYGWEMQRTQPPMTPIKVLTQGMMWSLKRSFPKSFGRVAAWGHIIIARMGKRGIADYTGWDRHDRYVACEVKEADGTSMPCSRVSKEQRQFLARVPAGAAWVGVYWRDNGTFRVYPYQEKGSYKR